MSGEFSKTASGKAEHVAVIDIGSNSIRLVVYEMLSRAPLPRFNEKSLCALGRDLSRTGRIEPDAADCAVNAVRRFTKIASAMDCERVDLLGTEALRRATNGGQVLDRIEAAADRKVRILSGSDEAYFAARGICAGFHEPLGIVGDLGGGSLDLAEINGSKVGKHRKSISLGSLRASEILSQTEGSPKRIVDAMLAEPLAAILPPGNFYLVGGSWRALAKIHMALEDIPLDQPHGYKLDATDMRRFARSVWRMPANELSELPALSNRRAPHIRGAALVLDRVLKRLNAESVVVSSLGVREGWLFDLLPSAVQDLDPLLEGTRAFGRPRARVAEFADALKRWTSQLFANEDTIEKRLREAVCELSDIAWTDHRSVQPHLAMRRILQFPFVGIDHAGRAFLATALHARYSGDLDDPTLDELRRLTSPGRLQRAQILGRAMLVGHRLSGSVPELLDRSRLMVDATGVVIETDDPGSSADSDAVRNRLKMLAKAIGVEDADLRIRVA